MEETKPNTTKARIHHYTRLTALFPGLPRWAGTKKVKPIWILLKQETVSGSGISWAVCKSAPHSSQITTPAPHHSVFYRPDALPAAQPTASKHWRDLYLYYFILFHVSCAEGVGEKRKTAIKSRIGRNVNTQQNRADHAAQLTNSSSYVEQQLN